MHRRNHETLRFVRERLECDSIVFVGDDPATDDAVAMVEVGGKYHILVVRADPADVRIRRLIYEDRRHIFQCPIPVRETATGADIQKVSHGRLLTAALRLWRTHVLPELQDRVTFPPSWDFPMGFDYRA